MSESGKPPASAGGAVTKDDLIAALERAEGNEPGLFWRAWHAIKGATPSDETTLTAWRAHGIRFAVLIDAGAFLDAAMMLFPSGWSLSLEWEPGAQTTAKSREAGCREADVSLWLGDINNPRATARGRHDKPAIALVIACLSARATGEGE